MRLTAPSWPLDVEAWATRVTLPAGATALLPVGDERHVSTPRLAVVASITAALRTQYDVIFGLEASIRARYFRPDTPHAGTWWYVLRHAEERHCGLSFELVTVRTSPQHLALAGILQAVYALNCPPILLYYAVQHLCTLLKQMGIEFVVLLDHGSIPHTVLHRLGFTPTGGARVFAVWGPQLIIERLPAVYPPYVLDW
jgi:hypothetical protein